MFSLLPRESLRDSCYRLSRSQDSLVYHYWDEYCDDTPDNLPQCDRLGSANLSVDDQRFGHLNPRDHVRDPDVLGGTIDTASSAPLGYDSLFARQAFG